MIFQQPQRFNTVTFLSQVSVARSPSQTTADTALPSAPLDILDNAPGGPYYHINHRPGHKSIQVKVVADAVVGAPEQVLAFYHAKNAAKVVT